MASATPLGKLPTPVFLTDKFLQQATWTCPICGCYNSPLVSRCRNCKTKR